LFDGQSRIAPYWQIMRAILLCAFASCLFGQTTFSISGPATVKAGKSITITIAVTGSAGSGIVGSQWSLNVPAGVTIGAPASVLAAAPPVVGLGQVFCGQVVCVLLGTLADGVIATVSVHFPKNAPVGKVPISLSGLVASNAVGRGVDGLLAGPALWVKVVAP
jgi:hypothetical protein